MMKLFEKIWLICLFLCCFQTYTWSQHKICVIDTSFHDLLSFDWADEFKIIRDTTGRSTNAEFQSSYVLRELPSSSVVYIDTTKDFGSLQGYLGNIKKNKITIRFNSVFGEKHKVNIFAKQDTMVSISNYEKEFYDWMPISSLKLDKWNLNKKVFIYTQYDICFGGYQYVTEMKRISKNKVSLKLKYRFSNKILAKEKVEFDWLIKQLETAINKTSPIDYKKHCFILFGKQLFSTWEPLYDEVFNDLFKL